MTKRVMIGMAACLAVVVAGPTGQAAASTNCGGHHELVIHRGPVRCPEAQHVATRAIRGANNIHIGDHTWSCIPHAQYYQRWDWKYRCNGGGSIITFYSN